MKSEFVEAYEKLFENSTTDLKKAFVERLKAMHICVVKEDFGTLQSQKSLVSENALNVEPENVIEQIENISSSEHSMVQSEEEEEEMEEDEFNDY